MPCMELPYVRQKFDGGISMKQFLKFLTKIKSFWKFYQNYEYDGEDVEFIIDNYERVLCNRTKTMSKPTYYLEDVLREIDNWYYEHSEKEDLSVCREYNYRTQRIDFSVEFKYIDSKEELINAVIKKMSEEIEKGKFPE